MAFFMLLFILTLFVLILILYVSAIKEILNEPIEPVVKILLISFIIFFNGFGLLIYYLLLRGNLTRWFR